MQHHRSAVRLPTVTQMDADVNMDLVFPVKFIFIFDNRSTS